VLTHPQAGRPRDPTGAQVIGIVFCTRAGNTACQCLSCSSSPRPVIRAWSTPLLKAKLLPERDRTRILNALGHVAPVLTASEAKHIHEWLRVGRLSTLAIASELYAYRFVFRPGSSRISKGDISSTARAWVLRGELAEEDAPRPGTLIRFLTEEELIEPFGRDEHAAESDDDSQEFREGRRLWSVGKAGYLFEISDPDRPHENYPIGRFPGSTPRTAKNPTTE